jgi:aminobenzoyl-glutamate transport protein
MRAASEANTGTAKAPARAILDTIERIGNSVPHPVVIFLVLIAIAVIVSHLLYLLDVSVSYQVINPATHGTDTVTTRANSLLTAEGIRHIYTQLVPNFMGFSAAGLLIIAMIGVGVAEEAGLVNACIRKLVTVSPHWALTYILAFVGILSSVASDAGYLVLIPLAGTAFLSVGRHPLAGLALGFAGVASAFSVNMLIKPLDAVLTELTNDAIHIVNPSLSIAVTANLWFSIASVVVLTIVIALITERIIEPRLGKYREDHAGEALPPHEGGQLSAHEALGLRYAGAGLLAVIVVFCLLTLPPGAPLRDPATGALVGNSPFMSGLIGLVMMLHRHRLRRRSRNDQARHGCGRCHDQGGIGAWRHHPAVRRHQPVRRLFHLQQHADAIGGQDGRCPEERKHRPAVAVAGACSAGCNP